MKKKDYAKCIRHTTLKAKEILLLLITQEQEEKKNMTNFIVYTF